MRPALLSLAMLAAIVLFGLGVYSVDAGSQQTVVNGYGVVAATH